MFKKFWKDFAKENKEDNRKEKLVTCYHVDIFFANTFVAFYTTDKKLYIDTMKKIRDCIQNNRLLVLKNKGGKGETLEFPFPREIKMLREYAYEVFEDEKKENN